MSASKYQNTNVNGANITVHQIRKVVPINTTTRALYFDGYIPALPGQFVLLWLPGKNQKPFCISYADTKSFAVTIQQVGMFTTALFDLKEGDRVGIQGPLGRAFTPRGKTPSLVGGGYGIIILLFLARKFAQQGTSVSIICTDGASTVELLDLPELTGHKIIQSKTSNIKQTLKEQASDMVYVYTEERATKTILDTCTELAIDAQVVVERYIKCGIGICGHCVTDPEGWRGCVEGPVFDRDSAQRIQGLGKYKRDETGAVCQLDH